MTTAPLPSHASTMPPRQARFIRLLQAIAPAEGIHAAPWPGLEVARADAPRTRRPVIYGSSLCIVAQGSKRAYLGSDVYSYDAMHYLVLSVPLHVEGEIVEASPERPFLALRLHLDASKLGQLLLELEDTQRQPDGATASRGIRVSPMDGDLQDAVCRLLAAVSNPAERNVLAPLAEREVLYRLLTGDQGELLRGVATQDGHTHRIARVLNYMQTHYAQPLDIATIAAAANMSPSTLHHTFKSVTSNSPLQYLKSIRLHQARLLMLRDAMGAGEAAHRVGYGSEFQFSREYRRLFGAPPMRDVKALRAEPPA